MRIVLDVEFSYFMAVLLGILILLAAYESRQPPPR